MMWAVAIQLMSCLVLAIFGLMQLQPFPLADFFLTNGKKFVPAWQLMHFVCYFVLTLLFPDSWLFIWLGALLWEVMEAAGDWGKGSDIAYNTAGVGLGLAIRRGILDRQGSGIVLGGVDAETGHVRQRMPRDERNFEIAMGCIITVFAVFTLFFTRTHGEDKDENNFRALILQDKTVTPTFAFVTPESTVG